MRWGRLSRERKRVLVLETSIIADCVKFGRRFGSSERLTDNGLTTRLYF